MTTEAERFNEHQNYDINTTSESELGRVSTLKFTFTISERLVNPKAAHLWGIDL